MAEIEAQLPLSQDKRTTLQNQLIEFGTNITAYQKKSDEEKIDATANVKLYASGIRNSSDLNSRKNRYLALKNELNLA